MSQLLAIASAALFGIADFAGGRATRQLSAWRVTAWSELVGIPLLIVGLAVVPAPNIQAADLLYGAFAGVVGLVGLALLYAALAGGAMSVVAPIIGSVSAVLPVLWDVATGSTIGATQWVGIGVALSAVVLIAGQRSGDRLSARLLAQSLGASAAFAVFFIAIAQTSPDSGLWPVVAARTAAIPIAFAVAFLLKSATVPPRGPMRFVMIAGSFDMAANIAILLSLQRGPLAVNVVLTSLYPAFTVAAALVILREHPTVRQAVGITLAIVAVVILAM